MPDFAGRSSRLRPIFVAFIALAGLVGATAARNALRDGEAGANSARGAVTDDDRRFWSFQKVVRPKVPEVREPGRARTPVDAFVLARLEAQGLSFSPEADRTTMIRRLYLDLVGLPPSPEAVAAFLADASPDACERMADGLLASPHFGERWGRHWLDVAGYVDTVGFDVDADNIITSERKWLYRDYVIRSFNEDKPYNTFLTEQLAGDELVDWRNAPRFTPEIKELLVATGFLRTAQDFTHEDVGNIPQNHFGILHDTLEIVGTSVLGLTLNCARCHDHKFDPLPQEDYYRLMAAFTPAYNPQEWRVVLSYDKKLPDRTLPDVSPADRAAIDAYNTDIDRQTGALTKQLDDLHRPYREKLFEAKLATLPEQIRADTKAALELPADKRSEVQKYLAGKFEGQLKISPDEISKLLSEADKGSAARIAADTAELNARRRSYGKIQALFDVGPLPATRRLVRGNYETPGEEVQPGFLRVLCEPGSSPMATTEPPFPGTSGRRLALAKWLTAPDSRAASLTARVMVNRLWKQLFGAGIVSTPENFGTGGEASTHPELLEWLSTEFIAGGWRVKPLIRQIVLSNVYRQSAGENVSVQVDPAQGAKIAAERDPDNKLLGRMRLKRLESEVIRDCVLAASGSLDETAGGPPVMLEARPDGMVIISEKNQSSPSAKWRRSVYLLSRRAFQLSEMSVFDQPVVATSCPERNRSAVPLQSLTMLNGAFLWEQAEKLAARLERAAAGSRVEQVALAFQMSLARQPTAEELQNCVAFLERQAGLYRADAPEGDVSVHKALVHLCHTLLNTSEFLYVP